MSQSSPFSFLFLISLILKPPLLTPFHILLFHFFFSFFHIHIYFLLSSSSTLIFILYFHINRTSLSPLFFTSSSSSYSFPFPSTIGLLPGSWLIKGYVTALTVFLITLQVLNFERSLNLLSLFWHTLTAHFKPSKLTPRARIDWHNTPLFKEDCLHFYSKTKCIYLVMAFSHECLGEKMLIIYFPSGWFDLASHVFCFM